MRVLGIEGTAWAASAAVYETDDPSERSAGESVSIETEAYQPDSGGIHPREAAEHMREAIPEVVGRALGRAREAAADDPDRAPDAPAIDCVAFSRGPGLGPCLRIVGTAARALSGTLGVPLVGVNHMVAHLEIGRHRSGFSSPVCLNASGANAHVLAYRGGRYRVLGETMDTGVGNAIDKFTRHVGWTHPGGPKVERAAENGDYVDLPYVVKGMDFSFSGITSAAEERYDEGAAAAATARPPAPAEASGTLADVCYSLQENVFAMLTEVSERALSLTGADELVVGGGVAQNDRLRAMLAEMCDQRDADVYVPEDRFLRDNAGMIAVLGAKMYAAGDTLAVEDSAVRPDFRPDDVPVTWRGDDPAADAGRGAGDRSNAGGRSDDGDHATTTPGDAPREFQGAEATVTVDPDAGRVVKRRTPRSYRHPTLDERLRTERTRLEARLTGDARAEGVPTPVVLDVDPAEATLVFEYVGDRDLRTALTERRVRDVGRHLAAIHGAGFVHGDPTTRNVRVDGDRTYLVDFGLGYYTDHREDYAMDLHVFAGSLAGTADDADALTAAAEDAYAEGGDPRVLDRLREIEGRGRYQ